MKKFIGGWSLGFCISLWVLFLSPLPSWYTQKDVENIVEPAMQLSLFLFGPLCGIAALNLLP